MKKITVIGHFGFGYECLDGQTVKTKILTDELDRRFGESEVRKVDTHGGKKKIFSIPFTVMRALRTSENVIILPAHNGLRIIAPLLVFFNRFYKRKLHYAVVGGWLPEFLKNRKKLAASLKRIDHIYVETSTMKARLDGMGFENVSVMPNCKLLIPLEADKLIYPSSEPYKLCTFSRVMKEKGIEDAIDAVKTINEKYSRTVYELDIYGQVDSEQTEWFDSLKQKFPGYVSYKGLVPFDKSVEVLKDYFALLFPTYYNGEGFAGTIIDAMAAGVPVFASNWKYNSEVIKDFYNGLIYESINLEELIDTLVFAYENISLVNNMRINCLHSYNEYLPDNVMKVMLNNID